MVLRLVIAVVAEIKQVITWHSQLEARKINIGTKLDFGSILSSLESSSRLMAPIFRMDFLSMLNLPGNVGTDRTTSMCPW